ncbi:MAG TPA: hypothetical protein VNT22_00410 [Baekduia sp.]|nr:hypothetical protein [Baekduia sp.]
MRFGLIVVLAIALATAVSPTAIAQTPPAAPPTTTDPKGLQALPPGAKPGKDSTVERSDTPALVVIATIGGLALVALLVWVVLKFFGLRPRWLLSARHAFAEVGWRASLAWADFSDWLRTAR